LSHQDQKRRRSANRSKAQPRRPASSRRAASQQSRQHSKPNYNSQYLLEALSWLFATVDFSSLQFRQDCSWLPRQLAAAALLWVWSDEPSLGERFAAAHRLVEHLYQPVRSFAGSVQAFQKMLVRWTDAFVACLQAAFRERMQTTLEAHWQVHGFAVFGVDGSRFELPRTRSNEAAYSPPAKPRNGKRRKPRKKPHDAGHSKKAAVPQMWLTLLWHVGTGLPWAWREGPSNSSEREHWREMLSELPAAALIVGDAGFIGYNILRAVLDSGRDVIVRVGSNVRLLRNLGWTKQVDGAVYLWPDEPARKSQPPLVLRLVVSHTGKHPVYMVTSVRRVRLSDRRVIDIYRRRWGIELFYRHFKQTYDRRKLRSASAAHARLEMHWSLLGLWAMALYAQVELAKRQLAPQQLSVAKVLKAFRRMQRDYLHPVDRNCSLRQLLQRAVRDPYERSNKCSRHYPRKKRPDPPAGPPRISEASQAQIQRAQQIKHPQKRLTA
jgi:hypothetical protein